MIRREFRFLPILSILLFYACGGSDGSDGPDPEPPAVAAPSAAALIFPSDDTECNTGEVLNESQSNVTFEWSASQNTDSYELTVTNLISGSSSNAVTSETEATILIARGTPFEWFVTSRANGTNETATSEAWRFYNEGPGVENYAPFPAEAISPARGVYLDASTTAINLEWDASDVDNDIANYEVFFGTDETPTQSLGITTDKRIEDVSVTSNTTYYWNVVVNDAAGNSSTSERFEFRVN